MTPTQGEHAQTALAHELFAAAQLAPGEGIEDAVSRIAAALTAAPAQPAAPQGVAYAEPSEFPAGAIVNGRTHIDRLESFYSFDCEAGPLINCDDWHGLKRCFEHLAERASNGQAPAGPTNTKTHALLSTMIGLFLRAKEKIGYQPGSAIDKTVAEAVEHLKDWPYPETATAQAAPAAADFTTLGAAMRAIQQAIDLIGEPADDRMRTVKRVLRGAVIVAEDSGELSAPAADYDRGPQSLTVAEAARHVGKWLNERPNHPLDLRDVAMLVAHVQAPADGAVAGPLDSLALMKVVMQADEALSGRCTRGTTNWAAAIGKAVQRAVVAAAPQPAPPADSQPSSFGSPELQAMILARCVEKDKADSVLEDAATGMAAEYQRWIDFFHKGNGDYNDFLRIELNHDADRKQGASHD